MPFLPSLSDKFSVQASMMRGTDILSLVPVEIAGFSRKPANDVQISSIPSLLSSVIVLACFVAFSPPFDVHLAPFQKLVHVPFALH
jgi:hypothetical protein